jgi:hypothetical protein
MPRLNFRRSSDCSPCFVFAVCETVSTQRLLEPASTSRPKSDRERSCSTQQQLRLFKMDTMGVDCHPCARKQVQNVRFARREQGIGQGRSSGQKEAAGERFEVGFD